MARLKTDRLFASVAGVGVGVQSLLLQLALDEMNL
jgi:hypothetical protein